MTRYNDCLNYLPAPIMAASLHPSISTALVSGCRKWDVLHCATDLDTHVRGLSVLLVHQSAFSLCFSACLAIISSLTISTNSTCYPLVERSQRTFGRTPRLRILVVSILTWSSFKEYSRTSPLLLFPLCSSVNPWFLLGPLPLSWRDSWEWRYFDCSSPHANVSDSSVTHCVHLRLLIHATTTCICIQHECAIWTDFGSLHTPVE